MPGNNSMMCERMLTALGGAVHRYGADGWVGFDTPNTHRQKMCWARFKKLGGVMAWDAESDDAMELSREIKKQMDTASCSDFKEPSCQ
jgi:hypothetical protein